LSLISEESRGCAAAYEEEAAVGYADIDSAINEYSNIHLNLKRSADIESTDSGKKRGPWGGLLNVLESVKLSPREVSL